MTDYRLTSTMNMWTDDNTSMMEAFMTSDLTSLWPPPPPSSSASTSIHLPPPPPIAPFNPDTLQQRLQALIEGARENWTYAIFWKSTTNDFPGGPGPVLARGDGYYKGEEDKGKRIKASTSAEEQAHRKKVLRELNSLISGASPPENDAVDEEVTDTEWFFLVSMTQSFGPGFGLPGQAMYNSSLIWVAGAELLSGSHCERADLITMSLYSAKRRLKDLNDLRKSGYNVVLTFEALSVDEVVKSFVDRLCQTVEIYDMDFIVQLEGPKETLYEGGTWKVRVKFPDAYPYRPPSLAFVDPIFHPNISKSGGICVDLLGSKWDAGFNLLKVFREILPGLLVQPNPASPYNQEAAELMLADEHAYAERVRSYHHAR